MIFGPKLAAGAGGVVTVDGRDAGTFSTTAEGVLQALPQQLLFMQGDLDATQQHTVVVSYDKRTFGSTGASRRWLGIDYVLVDERVQGCVGVARCCAVVLINKQHITIWIPRSRLDVFRDGGHDSWPCHRIALAWRAHHWTRHHSCHCPPSQAGNPATTPTPAPFVIREIGNQ